MSKKIALVHDYIKEYGGAERVLEALHDMYPDAPVYTLVYAPKFLGPHEKRFKDWNIKSSFLQNIPFNYKFISIFRLIAPFVFKSFDFSNYDVVIVSATGAYNPNVISSKGRSASGRNKFVHICYCHTPPRYLYGYATAREWKKNIVLRILGETANHFLRMVDYRSSENVDIFIANSQNVAKRIEKFYRRDAIVVYPPVISTKLTVHSSRFKEEKSKSYYLTGGRLARAKHYDLIIKACAELGVPLKIFGKGFAGYEENLKFQISNLKNTNIELLGEVSDKEKLHLMQGAKAFIFAGEDEDFGIVPVEAMSVGTPVIAYKSGGVLETVIDPSTSSRSATGIFFNTLTVDSIVLAIKKFEKTKINSEDCQKQAEKFSEEKFIRGIKKIIDSC